MRGRAPCELSQRSRACEKAPKRFSEGKPEAVGRMFAGGKSWGSLQTPPVGTVWESEEPLVGIRPQVCFWKIPRVFNLALGQKFTRLPFGLSTDCPIKNVPTNKLWPTASGLPVWVSSRLGRQAGLRGVYYASGRQNYLLDIFINPGFLFSCLPRW